MPEESTKAGLSATDLAFERTMLAHERTLMAWIRTATSMISFGFTLDKFFDEMKRTANAPGQLLSPRIVGMVMIIFGLLSLVLAPNTTSDCCKKIKGILPPNSKINFISDQHFWF